MGIVPGYASLPARFASVKDRLEKQSALEAMRTQLRTPDEKSKQNSLEQPAKTGTRESGELFYAGRK